MAYGSIPSVGALRWRVVLATRQQIPDSTVGISEKFINPVETWAEITPIGLQTWLGSEQIDSPVTHRIVIRYQPDLDMFDTVLNSITRPDGTVVQELYRIRRMANWQGRHRFLIIDAEIERRAG